MSFTLLPPVKKKDIYHGSITCGLTQQLAPMTSRVVAGFGSAGISKDGLTIFDCNMDPDVEPPTLQHFEDMAQADPDRDWRFYLYLPLREAEYQRQGDARWVLVKSGEGFA